MPINTTLTDSEGATWNFVSSTDVFTNSTFFTGLALVDNNNPALDLTDGGMLLVVNGTAVNPDRGSVDEAGRELNTQAVLVGEIAVSRSVLVSDSSISAKGFARFLDSFTNTTDTEQTITVTILTDSGADGALQIPSTTSGADGLDTNDVGFVTDDANTSGDDPALAYVYGDANSPFNFPSSTSVIGDDIAITYTLTLKAGQTRSLLSFATQSTTDTEAIADLAQFKVGAQALDNAGFLAGLSRDEKLSIFNYTGFNQLLQPFTLTGSDGNRWAIGTDGTLSSLDTAALTSFNIPVLAPIYDQFQGFVVDEAEDEVTVVRAGFETAPDSTLTYTYKAMEEEGVIRLMLTWTGGEFFGLASIGFDPTVTTGANPALLPNQAVVPSGTATGEVSGVLLDDSESGSGGTLPALTYVFGATGVDNSTTISGNTFSSLSPNQGVGTGQTVTYLYYFALNDTGVGALADLTRLNTPGPQELAGLSAAQVAALQNFQLTENDRLQATIGTTGDEELRGQYWGDSILGDNGDDTIYGGASDDFLDGERGNDEVYGDAGDDTISGGVDFHDNLIFGGDGNDAIGSYGGNDTVYGGSGIDAVVSNTTTSLIFGGSGGDFLGGGLNEDTIRGGIGNDLLNGNLGKDLLSGGKGDDTLFGNDGNDTLIGGAGADLLVRGDGLETASYATSDAGVNVNLTTGIHSGGDAAGDVLVEIEDLSGSDHDDTLTGNTGSNVLTGAGGADSLLGEGGADTLLGDAGNDTLNGGTGADSLLGGANDDWYFVDSQLDAIVEVALGGTADRVLASVTFALAADDDIEQLTTNLQSGVTAINLTGNALNQSITGNAGVNTLDGSGGNDSLVALGGADSLAGGTGNDTLDGGSGADTLNGGGNIDRLVGGADNDMYFVDNALDVVVEVALGGTADRVLASASYTLGAGVEVEQLTTNLQAGVTAINLTGNALNQSITGNAGVNTLDGSGGNDSLVALGGADSLAGGTGNDTLDGGSGADTLNGGGNIDRLVGGADNDMYFVDNALDVVVEVALGGTADRVLASASYTLGAGVEVEQLTTNLQAGVTAINLTGNALNQSITGNAGVNTLDGSGGNDSLTGGLGVDQFVFTTTLGASNIDRITDFNVADDIIHIDNAVFAGLAGGNLLGTAFLADTTGAATTALHRILYETDTGALFFDADGNGIGAKVQFATLNTGLALTAADFLVI